MRVILDNRPHVMVIVMLGGSFFWLLYCPMGRFLDFIRHGESFYGCYTSQWVVSLDVVRPGESISRCFTVIFKHRGNYKGATFLRRPT